MGTGQSPALYYLRDSLDNERIPVVVIVSAGYINILFSVVYAVFVGQKSICTKIKLFENKIRKKG